MPKNCPMGKTESHACWDCIYCYGNSCVYTALDVIKKEHEKETPAKKCSKCFHYNVCSLWTTTDLDSDESHKYCYNHFISAEDVTPIKYGEWEPVEEESFWVHNMEESLETGMPTKAIMPRCSCCKKVFGTIAFDFKYCPECGAKMKEKENK